MLKGMFNSTTIPVLEQVVGFAQARHNVLAGNIANLDTPGYRVRDLSPERFAERLKTAIVQRDTEPSSYLLGEASHADGGALADANGSLEDILYHDDSSGSLEKQIAAISKNQMQHNLALSILTSQYRLLQTAISERA